MHVKGCDNDDRQNRGDRQCEECETPYAAPSRTTRLRGFGSRLGRSGPFERGFYCARKPILDIIGRRQPRSQRPCKLEFCKCKAERESYLDCPSFASDSPAIATERDNRLIREQAWPRGLDAREPE